MSEYSVASVIELLTNVFTDMEEDTDLVVVDPTGARFKIVEIDYGVNPTQIHIEPHEER